MKGTSEIRFCRVAFFTLFNPFAPYLGSKYVSGGIEGHVQYLSKALAKLGCEVWIVTMDNVKEKMIEKIDGVNLIVLPDEGSTGLLRRSIFFILKSRSVIKSLGRHRINVFLSEGGLSSPLAFFKPKSAKTVLTVHTLDGEDLANIEDSLRLGMLKEGFAYAIKYLFLKVWRSFFLLRSDNLLFVSNAVYKEFRKYYWYLPQKKCLLTENGFPKMGKVGNINNQKSIDFVYVGRIDKRKCVEDAIKAFRLLRNKIAFTVLIIGEGAYSSRIKSLVKNLELSETIKFTGYIESHEKVLEIVRSAKYLILPSSYESDPLVLKEALSIGTPCIVSDIPALKEKVKDGKNGFIFKLHNFEDLSKVMELALSLDRNKYEEMCGGARKSVVGRNWDEIAQQYLDVIKNEFFNENSKPS